MTENKNLYGLILAGGFSKRMGQDKALLVYHDKPQIEYVHALLQKHCEHIFLSKRPDQLTYKDIPAINDAPEFSNAGPLGGILSAMGSHPKASWLIMACDLPFVAEATLAQLVTFRDPQRMATAFKSSSDGLPEPLCAIWEGQGYEHLLSFFKKDIRCPRKVLINSDVKILEQDDPRWLDNVNDKEEYAQALAHLKG